jgi:hypothetical protein
VSIVAFCHFNVHNGTLIILSKLTMDVTPVQSATPNTSHQARRYSGASTVRTSNGHNDSVETPVYNLNVSPIFMSASYSSARHLRIDSSRNARIASHSTNVNNETKHITKQRVLDMNRWMGLANQSKHKGPVNDFFSSRYRMSSEQDSDDYGIGQTILNEQIICLREELRYLHSSAWLYSKNKRG